MIINPTRQYIAKRKTKYSKFDKLIMMESQR